MDIIAETIARHNAKTECKCSTCNITRMCDEMEALTTRTLALVAAYDARPATRVEARVA